jgi:hypothetical protein
MTSSKDISAGVRGRVRRQSLLQHRQPAERAPNHRLPMQAVPTTPEGKRRQPVPSDQREQLRLRVGVSGVTCCQSKPALMLTLSLSEFGFVFNHTADRLQSSRLQGQHHELFMRTVFVFEAIIACPGKSEP